MRRILVGIKRVIDPSVRIHLRPDGSGVITDGLKMSINPFCEIALEEALRIRERGQADEVILAAVGPAACLQQLRTGLALGADRAVHVLAAETVEPLTVARVLSRLIAREDPILVLLGKQAIDSDNNQTGQLLAGLWRRPQATFASAIRLESGTATVTRETDQGSETIEVDLPAVITADLRLNEPRFVKLPQLLKAKKMPIEELQLQNLGLAAEAQFTVLDTRAVPARPPGKHVESVAALVDELIARNLL